MSHRPLEMLVASFDASEHYLIEPALESLELKPLYQSSRAALLQAVRGRKLDGVLVDWDDRRIEGEAFVREIRASRSNAKVPVVILTGDPSTLSVARACRAGADLYLSRPLGARALFRGLRIIHDAMVEERRRYQRVDVLEACRVVQEGRVTPGDLLNLSATGALARVQTVPPLSTSVLLELTGPELRVPAWVVRHHGAGTVGLRFIWIDAALENALKTRVETCLEAPPPALDRTRAATRRLRPRTPRSG